MKFPLFKNTTAGEWRLGIAAFVIGAGVMAVELTASRLLAPYFGASMYVWTSLIVTVLLALSVGYYVGGKVSERNFGMEGVGFLSLMAATLLVLGMLVIPRFSTALSGLLAGASSATIVLFVGSLIVTLVVFALPVFMMAMAAPIIVKEWSKLGDVGAVAGRYFSISTAGSVLGTVAPTLLLVPWIGARATMYAVSFCFLALAFLLLAARRQLVLFVAAAIAIIALALPYTPPVGVVLERESPYQLIRVTQNDDGSRYLIFNEGSGVQSVYVPQDGKTGLYFDFAGALPLLVPESRRHHALIVGLAGGSVASRYRSFVPGRDIAVTGIEVDPAVIDAAREWFDLDRADVNVINEDGRTFFRHTPDMYDVIVVDAYSTQLYIPPHLATAEFFALTKTRLNPNGVLAMNVNASNEDSRLLKALANTVASQFKHVAIVPTNLSWNHLLVASDEPLRLTEAAAQIPLDYDNVAIALRGGYPVHFQPEEEYFTDDCAPIEHLTDAMIFEHLIGVGP